MLPLGGHFYSAGDSGPLTLAGHGKSSLNSAFIALIYGYPHFHLTGAKACIPRLRGQESGYDKHAASCS